MTAYRRTVSGPVAVWSKAGEKAKLGIQNQVVTGIERMADACLASARQVRAFSGPGATLGSALPNGDFAIGCTQHRTARNSELCRNTACSATRSCVALLLDPRSRPWRPIRPRHAQRATRVAHTCMSLNNCASIRLFIPAIFKVVVFSAVSWLLVAKNEFFSANRPKSAKKLRPPSIEKGQPLERAQCKAIPVASFSSAAQVSWLKRILASTFD